jgi:hypothetical protein
MSGRKLGDGSALALPPAEEVRLMLDGVRNWPTALVTRAGLRPYPFVAKLRDGRREQINDLGDLLLLAAGWSRYVGPAGAEVAEGPFDGRAQVQLLDGWRWSTYETFVRQDYSVFPVEGRVVLDLGASIGDTATYFAARGAAAVIGYELDSRVADTARRNLELNFGLDAISPGPFEIRTDRLTGDISALIQEAHDMGLGAPYLKMDIEGDEYAVLEETPAWDLRQLAGLILEFHDGARRALTALRAAGFRTRIIRDHAWHGTRLGIMAAW